MNLTEYIESGILELYALQCLSPSEMREVESKLKEHPGLALELERIYDTLEQNAQANAIAPSPHLKAAIAEKLSFKTETASDSRSQTENTRVIRLYQFAVAASISLLIISSALALSYRTRLEKAEGELALLNSNISLLTDNLNKASVKGEQLKNEVAILKNPEVKLCTMKGVPASPESRALVYWNPANKETYVSVKNLPAPPPGMQYQLWALSEGVPLDAGVFDMNESGDSLQKVRSVMSAQAFAVTLEKAGGSDKPTLEKMIVAGPI